MTGAYRSSSTDDAVRVHEIERNDSQVSCRLARRLLGMRVVQPHLLAMFQER